MISVIIPSYNRANTIKRSLESVLNQTYKDIEVIIVDDCSTDSTRQIIESYDDERIRYVKNDTNSGACQSRNNGITIANGEYIAFQDSDDFWRPNKLEIQLEFMKKCNADVCFCKFQKHGYPEIEGKIAPEIGGGIIEYNKLVRQSLVGTPTILAKTAVMKDIMFDATLKRLQDYDWAISAGRKYTFCLIDEILVDAYLQKDSLTVSLNYLTAITSLMEKYERMPNEYSVALPVMINKQANIQTYNGERVYSLYWKAYKLSRNKEYMIKAVLSFLGLLKIAFKIKNITY